jgi:beta-galactosidase
VVHFDVYRFSPHVIEVKIVYKLDGINNLITMTYSILGTGEVILNMLLDTEAKELPELPRFGINMQISDDYQVVEWYGRGPHENYCDRKTSAFVDYYSSTVDELYFPYVRPQENGTRTEVRWFAIRDVDGNGLMISGAPLVSFSALPYTTDDLDFRESENKHTVDLNPHDFIDLNIDLKQSGVGGDNSWGAKPLPQYRLPAGKYEFSFMISPLISGDNPVENSKYTYKNLK